MNSAVSVGCRRYSTYSTRWGGLLVHLTLLMSPRCSGFLRAVAWWPRCYSPSFTACFKPTSDASLTKLRSAAKARMATRAAM